MRRKAISAALLAGALVAGAPLPAQPMSELEESLGRRKTAPVIPPAVRPLVREATRDRIVVRGLAGEDIVVDIGQIEPESFDLFAGGRFLGFAFMGYEHFGYILVDRTMRGEAAEIATGARPAFSPDGRHFAAVQLSGADAGNLEGFALWAVAAQGTRELLLNAALPAGEDWRIEGWPSADCVALSAGPPNADGERAFYALEVGERLSLGPTSAAVPCNVVNAVEGGHG